MTEGKIFTTEEIVKYFTDSFNTKIKDVKIKKHPAGIKKNEASYIWMKIDKNAFKDIIKHLFALDFPHLGVISGNDIGNSIELIYHFTLNYGNRMKEIVLNFSVELPKSNPEIETICDLIPGALIGEREKQEFFGVKIIGIPDNRRLFLPEDFPDGVFPWRRDETGPEKLYRNLHEVKK
jgi:membrane-bound hydrogenase subunit beta